MEKKNERLFVDSNYFIALFNETDALTKEAHRISALISTEKPLVISNLIFLETVTVVSMRAGRAIARVAGEYLLSSPQVSLIHIGEDLQRESWRIFQETENKNISFVDCSTIAIMRSEGISKLLTFDREFKALRKHYRFSLYS